MKTLIKTISIIILFIGFSTVFAQAPPPPNNDNGSPSPGAGNTPVGGGAPIGGGLVILVSIALAYGYARYTLKKPDYTIEEES